MTTDLLAPTVDLEFTGTPAEVERQLAALDVLLSNAEYRRQLQAAPQPNGPTLRGTVRTSIEPGIEGEPQLLSWVPESRIPAAHRAFVRRHVDRVAHELGLGHITIRWFGGAVGGGDFWHVAPFDDAMPSGVVPPDQPMTVAFNAGLRGDVLRAIIAHEVRHVAQDVAAAMLADRYSRERDAEDFASAYALTEDD